MKVRGQLLEQVHLSAYTAWRTGGPARRIYKPQDKEDLCHFLNQLPPEEPLLCLGLGSNTLIRDAGFPGTVLLLQGQLKQINVMSETRLWAEAGVACPVFARFCARHALQGAEFLVGIPGTLGGALAMNAGCHGSEIWNLVSQVETINRQGQVIRRPREAWQTGYRKVNKPLDEWFLAAEFRLRPGNKEDSLEKMRQLLAHRTQTQPTSQPNCGSVFRNPPNAYAGVLIEQCGLKGYRIGGAVISQKHANFIVNAGSATSADIETLIQYVVDTVYSRMDLLLLKEVHIFGESR